MHQSALRTGLSLWRATGIAPVEYQPLDGRVRCDVAVVGAGITGALVGFLLAEAGFDTVLVDQGLVGCGSTEGSTGLLLYEVDYPLVDLIGRVGEASAVRGYRRGMKAIATLEELGRRIGDCEFQRRPALYLASGDEDVRGLQEEADCRRHFGFDVSFLDSHALNRFCGLRAPAALLSHGDAEVNPYRLTQALVLSARQNGLRVFDRTKIESLVGDETATLRSSLGEIEARHVVFATGYFTQTFLPHQDARLHTTYAIASRPMGNIAEWPDRALMWETARPYVYLRRTVDGRVIIGGEDTAGADDHENERLVIEKAGILRNRFERMFPGTTFEPEYAWAGTFAETADGLPYIGRVPGRQNVYLALGYGGNGITFSMIAAELLRDLIKGIANPDEGTFRFSR